MNIKLKIEALKDWVKENVKINAAKVELVHEPKQQIEVKKEKEFINVQPKCTCGRRNCHLCN